MEPAPSRSTRPVYSCVSCHAGADPVSDRFFEVAPGTHLCFSCAMRRGGEYDSGCNDWAVRPHVHDLLRTLA
ncbi:MAG: hypothetical protein MJE66_03655 [Proteobacteria bacterium]|nr:hypothetical protein [Pseudomonadota bacterium]